MKNYRLKKEAVQFFKKDLATTICTMDTWNKYGVDTTALEEVEDAYIKYGFKTSDIGSSLSGWGKEDGSHFHFTIHYPSVKFMEHDKFSNGKLTRELMDNIQHCINNYYSQFATKPKS